jgi:hypothetical protein
VCASGISGSLELTGGEYKDRERIHRSIADLRLLVIPASWSRVADSNPNWRIVLGFAPPRGIAALCRCDCIARAAQDVRGTC